MSYSQIAGILDAETETRSNVGRIVWQEVHGALEALEALGVSWLPEQPKGPSGASLGKKGGGQAISDKTNTVPLSEAGMHDTISSHFINNCPRLPAPLFVQHSNVGGNACFEMRKYEYNKGTESMQLQDTDRSAT